MKAGWISRWLRIRQSGPPPVNEDEALADMARWGAACMGGGEFTVSSPKKHDAGKARKVRRIRVGDDSAILHWTPHPKVARAFFHIGSHLAQRGLPVPAIRHHDAARHFFLTEDLGPGVLAAVKPESINAELVRELASLLADFHDQAGQGFDRGWCAKPDVNWKVLAEHCLVPFASWAERGFIPLPQGRAAACQRQFRQFCRAIDWTHAPRRLGHSDFHLGNLILRQGQVWVIDWDYASFRPAAMDLAKFLVFPNMGRGMRQWREEALAAYLERSRLAPREQGNLRDQLVLFEACWLVRQLPAYTRPWWHKSAHRQVICRNIRDVFADRRLAAVPEFRQMMLDVADRLEQPYEEPKARE